MVDAEVIETHATFSENPHDTGIMFKCGLFVSAEGHFAGVKLDGGQRTWTVPLQSVLDAMTAAGFSVQHRKSTSRASL